MRTIMPPRSRAVLGGAGLAAALGLLGTTPVLAQTLSPLLGEEFTGATASSATWVTGSPKGTDIPCLTAAKATVAGSLPACNEVTSGAKQPDAAGKGAFRLTDNSKQNAGSLLLNKPIAANRGLTFEFDTYQYSSTSKQGADGISFYIVDGAQTKVDPGQPGGDLGYTGVSGAFAGIGFDQYGNFSKTATGGGPAKVPNAVVLRGGASTGYKYVKGKALNTTTQRLGLEESKTRDAARRHVVVDVAPTGLMRVSIDFLDGSGLTTVLEENLNKLPGQGPLPDTVKVGWAASTGDYNGVHEISGFKARTLDTDLTVKSTADGPWKSGGTGAYTVDVAVSPDNGWSDDPIKVVQTLPDGVKPTSGTGDGWTCQIAGQTVTCTSSKQVAPGKAYPPLKIGADVTGPAGSVTAKTTVEIPSNVPGGIEFDTGNNTAETTTEITAAVAKPGPDLTVTAEPEGAWTAGMPGTLLVTVADKPAAGPTDGPVTVTFPAPDGTTFTSVTGDGWTCTVDGTLKTATCTRPDVLQPGASHPPIKAVVGVPAGATGPVTMGPITVAGATPDPTPADNTVTASVPVTPAPNVSVVTDGDGPWKPNGTGTITSTVSNAPGAGPATGPTTVTVPAPAGTTITAAAGDGWTCTTTAASATCTRSDTLAPGQSFPPVKVTVKIPATVPATTQVPVSSSVKVPGDADPGDNTSTVKGCIKRSPGPAPVQ